MINTIYKPKGSRIWRWKFRLRPADGKIQDVSLGTSDKQVAEKLRVEQLREKEHERAGFMPPKATRDAARRKLSEHLQDFLGDMRRRGKSEKYLSNLEFRVGRLISDCDWSAASDVSADSFQTWLRGQQELKDKTANDYLEAARCFFNWLVKLGRAGSNPLRAVEKAKTKDGKADEIRAFSDDEILRLLAVAGERKAVYLMAVHTGLRRSELAALKWTDLHLDALTPFVKVRASTTKNGKPADIRLLPEVVAALGELKSKEADSEGLVFNGIPRIERFYRDLKKAGIPLQDEFGRKAVFHSLRHTFGTNLARGGVASRIAMALMRHSDRRLTDKIYTDENLLGTWAALDNLPNYGERASQIASQILGARGQAVSLPVTTSDGANDEKTLATIGESHVLTLPDTTGHAAGNGGSGGARTRILHVDGDSFFASCEIALHPEWQGRPVWVGGGRKGNGIVIAANRAAKQYGVTTGMACYAARKQCPHGVLARPNYTEYRRISHDMFRVLEEYSPTLVPISIDEGFLDLTSMDRHIWRHETAADYVKEICARILREVHIPVSAGLASSTRLAKLATDAAKPGFLEIPLGQEKDFLAERSLRELSGIGKNRQRGLNALGARTFGEAAKLPSTLLKQKFGIWGQQLWLFANGRWQEPLLLEVKDRVTISSNTTLPYNEPDYEAALTFAFSESTRLVGQLRREQLQTREVGLAIRFDDFSEVTGRHRFREPQFQNSVINAQLEEVFRGLMGDQARPVRQVRVSFWNLSRLDTQPTLWGKTGAERWGALDEAAHRLNGQFKKTAVMTGAQLALQHLDETQKQPKAKCPFVPAREMIRDLWGTEADPLAHKGDWEERLANPNKPQGGGH